MSHLCLLTRIILVVQFYAALSQTPDLINFLICKTTTYLWICLRSFSSKHSPTASPPRSAKVTNA